MMKKSFSTSSILAHSIGLGLALSLSAPTATQALPATSSDEPTPAETALETVSDAAVESAPAIDLKNLTGLWVLNEELSDKPTPPRRPRMKNGGGPGMDGGGPGGGRGGGGMGGGGMGGGRGGGGMGGRQDDQDDTRRQQMAERMKELQKAKSRLEIFQEGAELNITDGMDITQLFYTDDRQTTIWTQQGEAQARAAWDEDVLHIAVRGPRDPQARTRTLALSEDGSRLIVTESRPMPGQNKVMNMKLVYDRQ